MNDTQPRVLITEQAIADKVARLGAQISRDYSGMEGLMLIGVLKGSFIFLADLSRRLSIPHTVDFIALSSYGAA
ncbi:MAG TPA: phosphoribosyltransferase family protein, partial [Gemmatimonadales bacterium]|nr:phosphoribosyltransferase family protein [Gemmatimonadales bacterium]